MKTILLGIFLPLLAGSVIAQRATVPPSSLAAQELQAEQEFQNDKGYTLRVNLADLSPVQVARLEQDLQQNPPVVKAFEIDAEKEELVFTHNYYLPQQDVLNLLDELEIPRASIISYLKNPQ